MDVRARTGVGGIGGGSSATADKLALPLAPPKRTSYADVFDQLGREQRKARAEVSAKAQSASEPATPSFSPLALRLDAGVSALRALPAKPSTPKASGTDEINPHIVVWAKANRIESNGETIAVTLNKTVHITDNGPRIELLHVSGLAPLKSVQNHPPFIGNSKVTDDAFDQSQALATASALFDRLAGYGIDLKSVYHDPAHHDGTVRLLVNGISEDNASYAPNANVYIYGTAEGKFHLASCKEILVHELAHGYFDHVAPGLTLDASGEGKPLHEAFGDLFAALNFGNPNISEDIAAYLASVGGEPSQALRVIANDAVLDSDVTEEHDRSLVYSGMIWSVTEKLAGAIGMDRACDLMFGAVAKTPFFMTTTSPNPIDVVLAFADGIRAHVTDSALQARLLTSLHAEAVRRKVIFDDVSLDVPVQSSAAEAFQAALSQVKERPVSTTALAGIARGIVHDRSDVGFKVTGDRYAGNLRRVTMQAFASDPSSHEMFRVDGGLLEVAMVGNSVRKVGGGALTLPSYAFETRAVDSASAVRKAKALTRTYLEARATHDKAAAAVSGAFDTLFSNENLKTERVVSDGRLCLSLNTMAGEFIVDLARDEVRARRLMHVYLPIERIS